MQKQGSQGYKRDQVIQIINSVIDRVHEVDQENLQRQLHDLKKIIEGMREELRTTRPLDIHSKHIPVASDELDAVVAATEEATGTIMDSCETIQSLFDSMDQATAASVEAEVTKIFEACSFQDITGQRITKVIGALKAIDDKVSVILKLVGTEFPGVGGAAGAKAAESEDESGDTEGDSDGRTGDAALLNGPQLPDQGISQEEIDRLLAEFD
ncbi:MAG: protein phosphatase CheZ [Alphaproteobacteria bacterium]|nr:protein phosphatase CheZ [Alphaproteobacteria bacterium]